MRIVTLLLAMLASTATCAQVEIQTFERYQQLSQFLERDDIDIRAFERFHHNHLGDNKETLELTKSIYLQACLKLEELQCALDRTNELLELTENRANQEQLLRLAVQLNYQNGRHLDALSRFNEWRLARVSLSSAEQSKLPSTLQAEVYTLAAHSAYQIGKWPASIEAIKTAIELNATKQRYQLLLASYQRLDAYEKEREILINVTHLYPNEVKFWSRLAQSSLYFKQPARAIAALSVVRELNQLTEPQRILLAQLQLTKGAPASAYQTLDERHPSAQYQNKFNKLKLHALLKSRQREQALQLLNLLPTDTQLETKIQLSYSEQEWDKAIALLDQQIEQQPNNPRWKLLKAIAHFELSQYAQAKPILTTLVGGKLDRSAQQWLAQIEYLSDAS
ncbi:tetratricopeptide repeat protein [Vibrio gigantis]|uniref:tetratricopeptide repeat protein n=1 Tax=Vibrio gigantis TaxID=296199 RepID=UPI003D13E306